MSSPRGKSKSRKLSRKEKKELRELKRTKQEINILKSMLDDLEKIVEIEQQEIRD